MNFQYSKAHQITRMSKANLALFKYWLSDLFKYRLNQYLFYLFAFFYYLFGLLNSRQRSAKAILAMERYYPSSFAKREIKKILNDSPDIFGELLEYQDSDTLEWLFKRSLILKLPVRAEDGVLIEPGAVLFKFTDTFRIAEKWLDISRLRKDFILVLEPSWSGYSLPEILNFSRYSGHRIIIQCSEKADYEFIESIGSTFHPVRFGSSDWVDPRVFDGSESESESVSETVLYDSIYVANYTPIKRIHVYLKALHQLKHNNYKAALVCGQWGSEKESILLLIEKYGLSEVLTVKEGLSQPELNKMLRCSKVCLLLSLKEGSNRSIFEALFANVPCVVLENNVGVNKNYINSETGWLVDESHLLNVLLNIQHDRISRKSPRKWALANISPFVTTNKLNSACETIAAESSLSWCKGAKIKVNRPEAEFYDEEDSRSMPSSKDVLSRYLR